MQRVQERTGKQKVGDQTTAKLSAAEIVKALKEHVDSIVTAQKAGSSEDEMAAESIADQSQIVLKPSPERNRKIQIFESKLADGQVIYHVVDLRKVSQDFKPVSIDIKRIPSSSTPASQSDAAGLKEPVPLRTLEEVAMSVEDPGLQHALKFSERLRTGESRIYSPEETKAMWEKRDRQMAELERLVAQKFGGPKP
jgi:hypothetical protein